MNNSPAPLFTKDYPKFPKIPRLSRDCILTEKIDGTNGLILVPEAASVPVQAGSRNRWIEPGKQDNYGFAGWVALHAEELRELGPGLHYGVRVEGPEALRGDLHLGAPLVSGPVEHLPVEVGGVHAVPVDEDEAPDAGRGQVQGGGAAEAPHAHEGHAGAEEPALAFGADPGEGELAGVAAGLVGGQPDG